jgi:hypothetical protein
VKKAASSWGGGFRPKLARNPQPNVQRARIGRPTETYEKIGTKRAAQVPEIVQERSFNRSQIATSEQSQHIKGVLNHAKIYQCIEVLLLWSLYRTSFVLGLLSWGLFAYKGEGGSSEVEPNGSGISPRKERSNDGTSSRKARLTSSWPDSCGSYGPARQTAAKRTTHSNDSLNVHAALKWVSSGFPISVHWRSYPRVRTGAPRPSWNARSSRCITRPGI